MKDTGPGRSVVWALVAAVAGFGACKEESFGDVPASEAPETVADTICGQADECGCFDGAAQTRDMCQTQGSTQWQALIDAGEAEGLTYDGSCVGDLLDLYASLGCAIEIDEQDFDTCRVCKFFHGSKRAGEACMPPQNEALDFGSDECAQGLVCDDEVCVDPCATVGEGGSCLASRCADGLECVYAFDSDEESATCVRPAGEGEDCSSAPCGHDLECAPLELVCMPRPPLPSEGEPCNGACEGDSYCDTSNPDSAQWICVGLGEAGEPCTDGSTCRTFQCEDGVCAPERPIACLGF